MMKAADGRRVVSVNDKAEAERCARGRVVLIDDDADILASLKTLVDLLGYKSECYPTAELFLAMLLQGDVAFPGPWCVVSDVKMPQVDGLELLRRLRQIDEMPLVLMSGESGLRDVVDAFRLGVVDFLIKPFEMADFKSAIGKALAISAEQSDEKKARGELQRRMNTLTAREREVIAHVAKGQRNRDIAQLLAISERMVKMHRHSAMHKLGVASIVELVKLADQLGWRLV